MIEWILSWIYTPFFIIMLVYISPILKGYLLQGVLFIRKNKAVSFVLAVIILIYVVNTFFSAQPLNNYNGMGAFQSEQSSILTKEFHFSDLSRPFGLAILMIPFRLFTNYAVILTIIGTIFGSITIILLFALIKKCTKSSFLAFLFCFILSVQFYFIENNSSYVTGIVPNSALLLFLMLLVIDKKNIKHKISIIVFSMFFRIESAILLALYIIQIFRKRILLPLILGIPCLGIFIYFNIYENPGETVFGILGISSRLLSLKGHILVLLPYIWLLFLIGLIFALKKHVRLSLIFILIMPVYIFFQRFPEIPVRYVVGLYPIMLFFASYGVYMLNRHVKNKLFYTFLIIVVFISIGKMQIGKRIYMHPLPKANLEAADYLNESVLLVTDFSSLAQVYKDLYDYSDVCVLPKKCNLTSDYVAAIYERYIYKEDILNSINASLEFVIRFGGDSPDKNQGVSIYRVIS